MDMRGDTPADPDMISSGVAAQLRVIGRGARGSRGLDREQARWLMTRMLRGELADTQLGAVLLALRMKGETADELLGFLQAVEADLPRFRVQRPVVVLASVNGARKMANQIPLLCMLLQQCGVATLVIGQEQDDGRLHTAALWAALHLPRAQTLADTESLLQSNEAVYVDLQVLSPGLAALMAQRKTLGVRNAAHTLVKLLAPLAGPNMLLSGFTHGEFGPLMHQVLDGRGRTAVVLHGCEGEAVPHPSRHTPLLWSHPPAGLRAIPELPRDAIGADDGLPPLGTDLQATSDWIRSVADGKFPAPPALDRFVNLVCATMHALDANSPAFHEESLP